MASRRTLKKNIGYIAGDLFTETLVCKMFIPGVDLEKTEILMTRILDMQDEFVRRANCQEGRENKKRVKQYYSKLLTDLRTEISGIVSEIGELSKQADESSAK